MLSSALQIGFQSNPESSPEYAVLLRCLTSEQACLRLSFDSVKTVIDEIAPDLITLEHMKLLAPETDQPSLTGNSFPETRAQHLGALHMSFLVQALHPSQKS